MNASQHASTSLVRRLISIEEYLAAKGLVSAKLVLVPKVEPSPASLVALRLAELRFETICRNSRLLNEAAGRWDDCEGTPTTAYSGERQPMIPRGEYRKERSYKRKVIGVGKRVPALRYCFDKKLGEFRDMTVLECKSHIVKYSTPRDPRKAKYKDLRCGQFRVKCIPLN